MKNEINWIEERNKERKIKRKIKKFLFKHSKSFNKIWDETIRELDKIMIPMEDKDELRNEIINFINATEKLYNVL